MVLLQNVYTASIYHSNIRPYIEVISTSSLLSFCLMSYSLISQKAPAQCTQLQRPLKISARCTSTQHLLHITTHTLTHHFSKNAQNDSHNQFQNEPQTHYLLGPVELTNFVQLSCNKRARFETEIQNFGLYVSACPAGRSVFQQSLESSLGGGDQLLQQAYYVNSVQQVLKDSWFYFQTLVFPVCATPHTVTEAFFRVIHASCVESLN